MQPRVDFISLGVRSVDASRRFYAEGLGWPVHREVPGEVVDPDGFRWEVAFNPTWTVDAGGRVTV
ncbi:hypothetical protein E7Y32_12820 [Arthrobacter sp. UKPF54-2]|uniref:VOC family protein n=1 Tax=Arthrobacter sp. UKPF54-2 TaxID=2600159 RepID=UPI0011B18F01|nr:VOC family protein [Arthrobacter sp. UKPF54-2]QDY90987.1 hypothetical protein E7Y32_12820 [Arthrobacter sp. UKPF54-2]